MAKPKKDSQDMKSLIKMFRSATVAQGKIFQGFKNDLEGFKNDLEGFKNDLEGFKKNQDQMIQDNHDYMREFMTLLGHYEGTFVHKDEVNKLYVRVAMLEELTAQ